MTLRCFSRGVPTMGPRVAASGAPQTIGCGFFPPAAGCEVRMMCFGIGCSTANSLRGARRAPPQRILHVCQHSIAVSAFLPGMNLVEMYDTLSAIEAVPNIEVGSGSSAADTGYEAGAAAAAAALASIARHA